MKMQNLYRIIENHMAAVAFAEAGENETAMQMAFPEAQKAQQKEIRENVREEIRNDNRPRLYT